jgi:ADP-ribosylglycohydrolase
MAQSVDITRNSISTALKAYAAGDAFGVAYEFTEFTEVTDDLLAKDGWPFGGVSDDTLLTLLTLATLSAENSKVAASNFLANLKLAAPDLRGLGPTTRFALGMSVKESEKDLIGKSNGGMMRTALLGLAFPVAQAKERRDFVADLARATHNGDDAILAAQIAAALFSNAIEGSGASTDEIISQELNAFTNVSEDVTNKFSARKNWRAPGAGISLDPIETLLAFTSVADKCNSVLEAYKEACRLKGDTDTVSALAGSLVAVRHAEVCGFEEINWLEQVGWDEISELESIVDLICMKRFQL